MVSNSPESWQKRFLDRHKLELEYLSHAQKWFDPLAERISAHQKGAGHPVVVGVNGCQGCGKSTFCDYVSLHMLSEYGIQVAVLSLDDFYLTLAQRSSLAESVHPLFATRGVPGTHDMRLLSDTITALRGGQIIPLPRFDKAADERLAPRDWPTMARSADIVLLEGWCLGASAVADEELLEPLNALERLEDSDGIWRTHANTQLRDHFPSLYESIDYWVMFQAPSFGCVHRWRLEQEEKLRKDNPRGAGLITSHQIERFIQHFERLTQQCLRTLPDRVDELFVLGAQRNNIAHRCAGSEND